MTIDKQALREELSNPAIGSKDHLRKLALALLDELDSADGYASAYEAEKWHYHGLAESEGERADRAEKALEAAEQERENWRVSFYNERFRADKLATALNAEHEQHVMASSALITQHVRANRAESRIAELESNPIATLDVQSGRADGNKFALVYSSAAHKLPDDVYHLCVAAAGIAKGA